MKGKFGVPTLIPLVLAGVVVFLLRIFNRITGVESAGLLFAFSAWIFLWTVLRRK